MALLTDGAFTLVHLAIWSLVTIIKSVTMTGARSSFRQTVVTLGDLRFTDLDEFGT